MASIPILIGRYPRQCPYRRGRWNVLQCKCREPWGERWAYANSLCITSGYRTSVGVRRYTNYPAERAKYVAWNLWYPRRRCARGIPQFQFWHADVQASTHVRSRRGCWRDWGFKWWRFEHFCAPRFRLQWQLLRIRGTAKGYSLGCVIAWRHMAERQQYWCRIWGFENAQAHAKCRDGKRSNLESGQ